MPDSTKRFSDYNMRDGLKYCHSLFAQKLKGRVAFIGGSITTQSWRVMTCEFLSKTFPQTEFQFVNAGLSGTSAELGAFRLPDHVFGQGQVDLLFLEFAVNGGSIRAMEGIVRQAKRLNPAIDICMIYFADTGKMAEFKAGRIPQTVTNHEKVAEYYRLPALFFYREIAQRIADGGITWEQFSNDSAHPNEFGNKLYAQFACDFLSDAFGKSTRAAGPASAELPTPLDPLCYERGRLVDTGEAVDVHGWRRIREWTTEKVNSWKPPADVLEATEPGATLSLNFEGTAVGIYTLAGMDVGTVEYSIDGSPFKNIDPFDNYCPQFHRPRHIVFADELKMGKHSLVLRTGDQKNAKSEGYSTRIVKFMVN